jgi:poly-gamma-glutamate synthesis protein (capsule biosynthesis protein)
MVSVKRLFFVSFTAVTISFYGCAPKTTITPIDTNITIAKSPKTATERLITIIAVGDNLIHTQLIRNAKTKEGYDFTPFYSEMKMMARKADIAFINQETLIPGKQFGYSGYPSFNGPNEIGDAIYDIGFNVINHATNHAMDKGHKALLATIDYWDKKPNAIVLGVHKSQEERDKPKVIEIEGVKFGFLAYTYGLNGNKLPKGAPYLVSLIDTKIMAEEIDTLRSLCDYLIVSMHWGDEYTHTPNNAQEKLARFLAEHNVDLVIGHHTHVLQPARWLDRKDGAKTLVYFSLGNFISAQNKKPRMLGGMAQIVLAKNGKTLSYADVKLLGTITHYEKGYTGFKVYLLDDYAADVAMRHAINTKSEKLDLAYLQTLYNSIVPKIFRAKK